MFAIKNSTRLARVLPRISRPYVGLRFQSTIQPKKQMVVERELPDPLKDQWKNRFQFVGFWVLMGVSAILIFNYEKTTSPIVTTTLHFLRSSDKIRDILGSNIDFGTMFPWISGELNQVKGAVNITFNVKGSKNNGVVRLVADRKNKNEDFLIHEWTLTVDGEKFDLFEDDTVDFGV